MIPKFNTYSRKMQNDHVKITSCLFTPSCVKTIPKSAHCFNSIFNTKLIELLRRRVMFTFNVFSSTKLSSSQRAASKSSRLAVRGNLDNNISAKIASFFVKRTCSIRSEFQDVLGIVLNLLLQRYVQKYLAHNHRKYGVIDL